MLPNEIYIVILFFKILVKISRNHTVIKLMYLVSFLPVESFKALVRGNNVQLPGRKGAKVLSDITVKLLHLALRSKAFAIRRIRNYSSTSAGR